MKRNFPQKLSDFSQELSVQIWNIVDYDNNRPFAK